MFETQLVVRLHDTDAAGIVFFANYFKLAHDAYETFMMSIGWGLDRILSETDYLLPVVHAEADYEMSIALGATIGISIKAEVGDTSFVLSYEIKDESGVAVATLKTVHVAVDRKTGKKISLPDDLRPKLLTIS